MYKSKLNHDQRLIKKLNDLPSPDRKSYIARLSEQAIANIIAYVASSPKWDYRPDGNTDRFVNEHLEACVAYDHTTDSLSYKR
jgi:hypothetical protein